jgi:hypothetical protein
VTLAAAAAAAAPAPLAEADEWNVLKCAAHLLVAEAVSSAHHCSGSSTWRVGLTAACCRAAKMPPPMVQLS